MRRGHSVRSARLAALAVGLLVLVGGGQPLVLASAATPANGSVGPASGSSTQWDFAPVSGGGLGGTPIEVVCQYPQCDKFALQLNLPQPDSDFYKTHLATLKFHCSWQSASPSDIDCFSFSPTGGETGPGSPDTTATGAN